MFHHLTRAAATAALLALAACGTTAPPVSTSESPASTTTSDASPAEGTTAPEAAGPISVVDGRGRTVELPAAAENVVALEWGEAEILLSLGANLVGIADPQGFSTWDKAVALPDGIQDVGMRSEPSVESILALDPDVVVLSGADTSQVDRQLEGKVPVVFSTGSKAGQDLDRLRGDVELFAQVLGDAAAGEALLTEMDEALESATSRVSEAGAAGTPFLMADGWKEGSVVNIRMFAKGSMVDEIATSIGLVNAWTQPGDEAWGLGVTDVEGMAGFTAEDLRLFYSASEDDVFADGLAENPIWQSLPFVQQGRIHKLAPGTWTFGGSASVISIAEQFAAAVESER
ncbi:ABC transporter substrate-binding protein [Tessaracoccus lubricantis]|uniref:ABC transporter substrate-binding protein n=1 Tax=Tessaracoccus lubricantis TaxID=545543 RepID=A0ABP9FJM4_9ACTN